MRVATNYFFNLLGAADSPLAVTLATSHQPQYRGTTVLQTLHVPLTFGVQGLFSKATRSKVPKGENNDEVPGTAYDLYPKP